MTASVRHTIALPGRFALDREIGRGGMAVVYRAHDNHLGRYVAIKVLSAEFSNTVSADRFQREIALMAKLVHPGIVALFDSGIADDRLYYVMPFVAGETLRSRLAREHRLTPQETASLGADIAEALAYAHGNGIVHRDVKPENVFAVAGRAVLADFGIARIVGEPVAGARDLTTGGVVLGTLAYMSPEQGLGEPNVDGRSDLYSLGCMLYELLCGSPPFVAATALAVLGKHIAEAPQPLAERGTTAGQPLQALVMQLLEKDPLSRPANAAEVARELRAVSFVRSADDAERVLPTNTAETVVVGALSCADDDRACAPIASAIGNAVASSLAGVPGVRVQVAGATAATLTVEGSVRRSGERVRVSMRVVSADGGLRWSEHADGSVDDVFALEDVVSSQVVAYFTTVFATLPRNARAARPKAKQSEADQLVSKAARALNQFGPSGGAASKGNLEEARAYLARALEIEPRNARALVLSGNLAGMEGANGLIPQADAMALSRKYTYEALAADDQCAEVYASMAKLALYTDDDAHLALRHSRRAVDLDPHVAESLRILSVCAKIFGRMDEAIDAARAATVLAPDAPGFWNSLGDVLLAAGRNSEAIDVLKRATALLPNYGLAMERLERAHMAHGESELALELRVARLRIAGQRERADRLESERDPHGAATALRNDVRHELNSLLEQARRADPFAESFKRNVGERIAAAYGELGEWSQAMDWVERAYERRPGRLRRMLADMPVDFRGLAVDPRYTRLLRVAGLEDLI